MTQLDKKRIKLSIVIVATNNSYSLKNCLDSLKGQVNGSDTEIIIVSNYIDNSTEMIDKAHPHINHFALPKHTDVPQLRTYGINNSCGELVALIEDNCVLDKNWHAEIKIAYNLPYAVVGGPIENSGSSTLLDWAVYFYEYGRYMLPIKAGIVDSLPGINVLYKRAVLNKMGDAFRNGFYETFFNDEVIKRGHQMYLTPSAIVYHKKNYRFWETLIQFHQHGYIYAGKRVSKMSPSMRPLSIFGSIALPILLLSRIVLRTFRKRKNLKKMIFSLPYIVLVVSSWSFGEFRGYLFGKPSIK